MSTLPILGMIFCVDLSRIPYDILKLSMISKHTELRCFQLLVLRQNPFVHVTIRYSLHRCDPKGTIGAMQ